MSSYSKSSAIKNIALFGEKLSLLTYIVSAVSIIAVFSLAAYLQIELYLLLGIVGIALLWIMLHYPKVWIYLVIVGCALFFDLDEEGISAVDIFAAIFFNTFLIIWFFTKLLVNSDRKLINFKNISTFKIDKLSDKLFLLFYFFLSFNIIVAFFNGIDPFDWIREYMLFSLMLYYFPIRDYFNDKKSIIILLVLFAFVAFRFDIRQFFMFAELMNNVSMAYEIGGTAWKINQGFYSAVILMGTAMFLYTKNKISKLFAYSIVLLTTFTLISTFARAFWLSVMALIAVLTIFYTSPRQLFQLLAVIVLTTGILFLALDTYFPKQSEYVQQFIVNKFSSSTQGRADPSVESRVREFSVVRQEIYESPIFGHGFKKHFSFYNNIESRTAVVFFIHNGYLYLAHKAGIPMTILFYFVMLLFNIRGYIVAWRLKRYCARNCLDEKDDYHFFTALAIGASLIITMLAITNMVTTGFFTRDCLIITAFSLAFITIAERKYAALNNCETLQKITNKIDLQNKFE